MNSLSWFIYLTQTVDELRHCVVAIAIMTGIGFGGWLFFGAMRRFLDDEDALLSAWRAWALKAALPILLVAALISVFVPSRQTMLLIAGSQLGERMVQSEEVKSVVNPGLDLLKGWMKSETERLTKERRSDAR